MAVRKGLTGKVQSLLESKGEPNIADRAGVTAAHLAAGTGSVECLKTLIEFGADVNATTQRATFRKRKPPRDRETVEALNLVSRCRLFIERDSTPLHLAAQDGCLQGVRLLLDHGADINAINCRQQTPLFLAARGGHPECVMMLLHSTGDGPDVSIASDALDTALIQCMSHGEKMRACIRELVCRGADVCHHDVLGLSAVHKAVEWNWDMDITKLLILEGRGMDFDRTEARSPLQTVMRLQVWHYSLALRSMPPFYTEAFDGKALLFLRMGATRRELKKLLWYELNLPKPPGVLLETLMNSLHRLPSLSELEADLQSGLPYIHPMSKYYMVSEEDGWVCSGFLWHYLEAGMTEEARRQEEERLKAVAAEKKQLYHQRSTEVPSLAHLSRAAIRSSLQADVRQVIFWPVPQCVKRYILLGHDL